jgi:hypothetical protein
MFERLNKLVDAFRWRIHLFALGMTLALGMPLLGQGCVTTGQ